MALSPRVSVVPLPGLSPLSAAEAAASLCHPLWGAGGSCEQGRGEGRKVGEEGANGGKKGKRKRGKWGGKGEKEKGKWGSPTYSVPFQLRRAIEELANPK